MKKASSQPKPTSKKKPRRILFWKVSGVLLLLLAMEGGITGTALYFAYKLKGDANTINYAGQERYRSYQLAFLINEHVERGAINGPSRGLIEERMAEFEELLYGLRDGNKALGLKRLRPPRQKASFTELITPEVDAAVRIDEPNTAPTDDADLTATSAGAVSGEQAIWVSLTRNIAEYHEDIRPALLQILDAPDTTESRALLSRFNSVIPEYVSQLDDIAKLFTDESAGKVAQFQIFLFTCLGVIVAIIGTAHFLAWAFVERPIGEVRRGMQALIKGGAERKLPVRSRDEIGDLAKGFNVMAETIKGNIREIEAGRDRLNTVLANMGCMVRVIDPETHKVLLQNEPLRKFFPEGLERDCYRFWGRETECERCVCREAIRDNAHHWKEEETAEGIVYEIHAFPIPNPDGTVDKAIEVIRDITRKTKMEAEVEESRMQLLQSQKMAAIGSLSSGVAHSINNPLSGIHLFSDVLLKKIEAVKDAAVYGELKDGLTEIKAAARRCEIVVKDLLRISRMPKPERLPVYINKTLEDSLNVFAPQLKLLNIKLVKELSPTVPMVLGSHTQLETVFISLISNAVDAMPDGGTLTIESRYVAMGKKVEISIADTGCGITKQNMQYVMNPYFTTKPPGKGTGIGLSSAQITVQSHRGTIEMESQEGRGTTVRVKLPVYESTLPSS